MKKNSRIARPAGAATGPLGMALALSLLLSACGGGGNNDVSAPPTPARSLGLMQLTVNGIGSGNLSSHATLLHAGQRANIAGLSSIDTPDGLDVEQVSASTVDVGTRGAGGMRYISVVYQVRNAQSCATPGTCTPYTSASQSLTFVAANASGNLANTAATAIYREDGSTDATEQALATQMLPTDGMAPSNPAGNVILAGGQESLQVFNESEITGAFVDPGANYLFPYGYVVENVNTPGSRALPASPANNQWDGQLTFAFKVPLQDNAKDDPFSISFVFDVLDDSNTRVTESAEEQNLGGDNSFGQLAVALGSTDLAVLGGHIADTNIGDPICTVRTAGPSGAATAYLVDNAGITVASAPSIQFLSPGTTLNFGFCAPIDAGSVNAATVVFSGSQSGLHPGTLGDSGNVVSFTPTTAFAPGETVSYTLTTGLLSSGTPLVQPAAGSFIAGGLAPSTGTFALSSSPLTAGKGSVAVTVADFNGDGKPDLVTSGVFFNHNLSILLNNGDGTFTLTSTIAVSDDTFYVAAGDFNGDGKLDIAETNTISGTLSILLGNGDGTFTAPPNSTYTLGTNPFDLVTGDFNGDGKLDLAVTNNGGGTVSILLGNGDGSFTSVGAPCPVGASPRSLVAGDFNGDGKLDLAVTNSGSSSVSVLLGKGDGTFNPASTYGAGNTPFTVVLGDFNGDGKLDLATANNGGNNVSILLGHGDGSFAGAVNYAVGSEPLGMAAGDFNGDGRLDLAVVNSSDFTVSLLRGKGDGTFTNSFTSSPLATSASTLAAGDFNGDGKLDLAVPSTLADASNNDPVYILTGQ